MTVLDAKTHAVVKTIPTGERPRDMKLNATRDKLYVIASNSERDRHRRYRQAGGGTLGRCR